MVAPLAASRIALFAVLVTAAPAARADDAPVTVAILPLMGLGLSDDALLGVEGSFREAVRTTTGVALQDRSSTIAGLTRARDAGIDCDEGDVACLRGLGGVLGVGKIISGTVSEDPYKYGMALKILDVETGEAKKKGPLSIGKDPAELIIGMRRAAAELLEVYTGALEVLIDTPARVLLDGVARGTTPLPAMDDVPVGAHTLTVEVDGVAPFTRTIDVKVGERTRVELEMADGVLVERATTTSSVGAQPSGLHVSVPLTVAGGVLLVVAAGALVGGLVTLGFANDAGASVDAAVQAGDGAAMLLAVDENHNLATATSALYITSAAAAAVGAGALAASFFIDPFAAE